MQRSSLSPTTSDNSSRALRSICLRTARNHFPPSPTLDFLSSAAPAGRDLVCKPHWMHETLGYYGAEWNEAYEAAYHPKSEVTDDLVREGLWSG